MLLGVTRQAISKWESEKAYPEMDKLLMICDLFGCTLDDLVLGDVQKPGEATAGGGHADRVSGAVLLDSGKSAPAVQGKPDMGDSGSASRSMDDVRRPGRDAGSVDFKHDASRRYINGGVQADAPAPAFVGDGSVKDATGYDAQMKGFAWKLAAGVGAMAVGVAFSAGFGDCDTPLTDMLSFAFVALGAVVGLALILFASTSRRDFMRRHPYVEDFYTDRDRTRANAVFVVSLVGGVAEACLGIVINQLGYAVFGIGGDDGGWPMVVMMLLFALAVASFIYGSLQRSRIKIDRYNRRCERHEDWLNVANGGSRGLYDGRGGRDGGATADRFGHPKRFYTRLSGAIDTFIMLVATLLGLLMLFLGHETGMGPGFLGFPFWLTWPVGGIICAVADAVIQVVRAGNA